MASHGKRLDGTAVDKKKFLVLLTAGSISSLIMLDSNIVAVSLPSIARSLGGSFTEIEWVVSAYVLPFAALLLAAGSYADRHGRKLATLVGLAVFTIASGLLRTSYLSTRAQPCQSAAGDRRQPTRDGFARGD
jgi:MFS family permease